VRGLRKKRAGYRGFRPGILILAFLAAIAGCSGRGPGAVGNSATWLQLQSGSFQPVKDPAAAAPVARRPWTVQSRVADMAFLDGTLYLGLNGSGLATVGRDPSGTVAFSASKAGIFSSATCNLSGSGATADRRTIPGRRARESR
jgi:hypothetical protein